MPREDSRERTCHHGVAGAHIETAFLGLLVYDPLYETAGERGDDDA